MFQKNNTLSINSRSHDKDETKGKNILYNIMQNDITLLKMRMKVYQDKLKTTNEDRKE